MRKRTSYNLGVKLNVIHRNQRGECTIDIACALQTPETIHTILKSSQEIETKALNLLRHSEVKITRHRSDVMEIVERHLETFTEDLYQQHAPVSLALIQENAVSLHEAVNK
jgi:hypothetical protein